MSEVTFAPFQKVLVRDGENAEWVITLFCHAHHYEDGVEYVCLNGTGWPFCLPYTEETAHLLGTTDSPTPPEPEFKWGDHVEVKNLKDSEWKQGIFLCRHNKYFLVLSKSDGDKSVFTYCRHAEW